MATTLKENVTVEMHTFTAEDARGILHRTGCKVQVRSRGASAQHSCRTAEGLEVDLESLSLKRNHSYSERTAPTSCAITSGTTVVASIFSGIPRPRHFASSAYSSAGAQEPWDRAVGAAAASAGCYSWTTARQYYQIN